MSNVRRRTRRGLTLIESLFAVSVTAMAIFSATGIWVASVKDWAIGQDRIETETESQIAVRVVADHLREAMTVQIDADGQGISYRKPQTDSSGDYLIPPVWDGVERRIYLDDGSLWLDESGNGNARELADRVVTNDPGDPDRGDFEIFTPGPGTIIREVTVFVATEGRTVDGRESVGRHRETIYLRNVPSMTQ
jgi:type II secretory pathway pseudopilin PulG